jgi:hypothetical protein
VQIKIMAIPEAARHQPATVGNREASTIDLLHDAPGFAALEALGVARRDKAEADCLPPPRPR